MEFVGRSDDDDDESEESGESEEEEIVCVHDARENHKIRCLSCQEMYRSRDAGTCRECYEEASETEEELKRQIDDLKSKLAFLQLNSGSAPIPTTPPFPDLHLLASDDCSGDSPPLPIPANRAVLACRSPVFRAMLENQMEESISGTIKIGEVSHDALQTFVHYLYTAEASLDENMAYDLLVLAEKYEVPHLKIYCEKFLKSILNWDNSIPTYAFAHQHNSKILLDASLSLIISNMEKLSKREDYTELVEKDPRLVVEIYEAYLKKQVNTASYKYQSRSLRQKSTSWGV